MRRAILTAARAQLQDPLFRSAYSLIVNTALNAVLGLVFWVAAARLYSPEEFGRDAALIATMVTLSSVCQLNLAAALARFLPHARHPGRRVLQAYAAAGATSVVVAAAFVLIAPRVADGLGFLADAPTLAVAFVAATALWGVFALQDAAITASRRAEWIPVENSAFGVLKLAALPLLLVIPAVTGGHGIFTAWVVPMALLIIPVNLLLFRRALPRMTRSVHPEAQSRRWLAGFLAQDYAASVLSQVAVTLLPIIVVAMIGTADNAYFYVAFTIVQAIDLMVWNIATSLTVESAIDRRRVAELARAVLRRFRWPIVGGSLGLLVAGGPLLSVFGGAYAENGLRALQLLALAVPFRAAISLFTTISRALGHARPILVCDVAQFTLTIGLAILLAPTYGITGVAFAWLAASVAVALPLVPWLIAFVRVGDDPRLAAPVPGRRLWRSFSAGDDEADIDWAASGRLEGLVVPALPRARERLARLPGVLMSGADVLTRSAAAGGPQAVRAAMVGVAGVAGVACLLVSLAGVSGPVAALAMLALFATGPGAAVIPLVAPRPRPGEAGLVLATSLAACAVGGQLMLWADALEPRPAAALLAVAVLAGIALQLLGLSTRGPAHDRRLLREVR